MKRIQHSVLWGAAIIAAGVVGVAGARAKPRRTPVAASGARSGSAALFLVRKAGKWGFVNRAGRVVIPFQFALARKFREGGAVACNEGDGGDSYASGSCGFIDTRGQWILRPQPGYYEDFSDGLARVKIRTGAEQDAAVAFDGWVDAAGNRAFALPEGAGDAESFHEGFAVAWAKGEKWESRVYGTMDARGRWAIAPRLPKIQVVTSTGDDREIGVRDFSHGLAVAQDARDPARVGFINAAGEFVIAPRFDGAQPFSEGLALVQTVAIRNDREVRTRSGFINLKGQMVIPARFMAALPFSNGLAIAEDEHFNWGYINARGDWAIKPHLGQSQLYDFSEEVAGQMAENGQWGFIDKRGRWVIKPRFDSPSGFENGLASVEVRSNEKTRDDPEGGLEATIVSYELTHGLIDHAGRWVWKATEHHEEHRAGPSYTS